MNPTRTVGGMLLCILAPVASAVEPPPDPGMPGAQYALVIGINDFLDKALTDLNCCVADAQAFYNTLVDPRYGRYPAANTTLLLDAQATAQAITTHLRALADHAGQNDTVTIFFASHGLQDSKGHSYWVTHDTTIDRDALERGDLELGKKHRLDNDTLASLFDRVKANRFIVFLDCCFSADTVLRSTRGIERAVAAQKKGPKDPFAQLKGKGRVILASSDGYQHSAELGTVGHGVFTYYLLEGLAGNADEDRGNVVEVLEVWRYLENKVEQAAKRVGVDQKPTMSLRKFTHHFPLTTYPLLTEPERPAPGTTPQLPSESRAESESKPPEIAITRPEPEPRPEIDFVRVTLPGGRRLKVGAHEVTNARFAAFIEANPQWGKDNIDPRYHDGDYLDHWAGDSYPDGMGGYPVVHVSWFAAKACAEWLGARLPTVAEWQAVAGGPGGTTYPWGDRWDPDRCNNAQSPGAALMPAGSFERGPAILPAGRIYNLAGNAAEWCDDFYYRYDEAGPDGPAIGRAVKGGSFRADRLGCTVTGLIIADPRLCSDDAGFRVCSDQ